MSILAEEPSIFPAELLDAPLDEVHESPSLGAEDRSAWWVIHTKSRQEKALARELLQRQTPFYLPLIEKTTVYSRQRVQSYNPLFTGYVFMYGSWEQRCATLVTNRIARVFPVGDPRRLLHDLRQIRQLIGAKAPLTVESRLAPGQRVRVRHGPLAGLEGTVLVRRGQMRLLVQVDFLQQGASVEIEDFMVEPTS